MEIITNNQETIINSTPLLHDSKPSNVEIKQDVNALMKLVNPNKIKPLEMIEAEKNIKERQSSSSSSPPPPPQPQQPPPEQTSAKAIILSEDEIRTEKCFLLQEFNDKNQGQRYVQANFSMNDNIETIKDALSLIKAKRSNINSLKFLKSLIRNATLGIVMLNNKFDPFNVDLTSWSTDVFLSLGSDDEPGDLDDILSDIVAKWRGKVPIAPELQLLLVLHPL